MGSSIEKSVKRSIVPLRDNKFRQALEKPFRTGATGKQREIKKASLFQQQRENVRLAEAEDEVARRRGQATSGKGGRQSLIRSSGGGLAKTLGGG